MTCPKCNCDMEYEERDPDVGIMSGGYVCTNPDCDYWIDDWDIGDEPDGPN